MQKLITVTTHTNIINNPEKFTEKEYPTLNKYLEEGYKVIQTTPIVTNASGSYMYSITFLLEK
jgi:hypothetical protein